MCGESCKCGSWLSLISSLERGGGLYCTRQSVSYKPAFFFPHPKQSVLCKTALFSLTQVVWSHKQVVGRELNVRLLARPKGNLKPTPYPAPYTLLRRPYFVGPTPYTLHPTPYALHPSPAPHTVNLRTGCGARAARAAPDTAEREPHQSVN